MSADQNSPGFGSMLVLHHHQGDNRDGAAQNSDSLKMVYLATTRCQTLGWIILFNPAPLR